MISLELPKDTIREIRINDKIYTIDISDFGLMRKIKDIFEKRPSISEFSEDEINEVLNDCQTAFHTAFGEIIVFSNNKHQNVFYSRACLKQIYELILKFQDEYLNSNYPVRNDSNLDKYLELSKNLAKVGEVLSVESEESDTE